ncbi:MAG: class IV adenylate cyclase [Desulfococcaceae bacterium]
MPQRHKVAKMHKEKNLRETLRLCVFVAVFCIGRANVGENENMPLEIEVKFYVNDRESLRTRILAMGAKSSERVFEENIRFEDASVSLMQRKALLRLRQDRKAWLTFKSRPAEQDSQFKIFEELETEVSDFSAMHRILEALGFHPEQRYEKWRETFVMGNTHLCLDTMPFGDFLEIEGDKSDIPQLARELDLQWEKRILQNYLVIFSLLKEKLQLPFADISFENFQSVDKDMSAFIRECEVGHL